MARADAPSLDAIDPRRAGQPLSTRGIVLRVLLPFSTGYFLSYYFRTVNAVLSERLTLEFNLSAAELGTITAAYFLVAALAQLPLGWALDRFGPRGVQSRCLLVAALGAGLFSLSSDFRSLFLARALIGIGVASALLAGMKALAMTCPKGQLGLLNGIFMSIGAAGAIAASEPTEFLLQLISWRQLLGDTALATAASALLIAMVVPRRLHPAGDAGKTPTASAIGYSEIFRARDFWQVAPLSATAIGAAWALQGLWSAPYLRDVTHLDQGAVAGKLLVMALALSIGALVFGVVVYHLGKYGIAPSQTLKGAAVIFILAEVSLAFPKLMPAIVPWCIISAFAAGTVLTYTISAQRFPKESVGRANSAFNVLHFAAAFAVQIGFGQVLSVWPRDEAGHYPLEAYRWAVLGLVALQASCLLWFWLLEGPSRAEHRSEPQTT